MHRAQRLGEIWKVALVVACGAACGGSPSGTNSGPKPPAVATEPMPAPRADGRLPESVIPRSYDLALDVDPKRDRFSGTVRIDVDVPKPTSWIVLSARDLRVTRATAVANGQTFAGHTSVRRTAGSLAPEELVIGFDAPLPPGRATLTVAWDAPWGEDLSGLYRVRDGERLYAFTQFEATDARRAFPCFDEPGFKTPFTVHVTAPKEDLVVANAAEASRETPSGTTTTYHFAPTRPLPTYLVAFAVGDFDVRALPRPEERTPIRLIAPKGKADMGTLALETTAELTDALERWIGVPYPYDKLDIVAVPEFAAGAMENAGLITFRDELLLLDPEHASVGLKRNQALVIAHELAHQWFGNLVTAAWWDDLWLNEGFATWMETKIVDVWRPSYQAGLDANAAMLRVMDLDGFSSARAVRQPVTTTGQVHEAFDGITYQKGAAILGTIASWIGETAFRNGVRDYLTENAHKSARADRLLSALDRASRNDVTTMASSFLDQPGVPEITVDFACDRGTRWHAELVQEAWRPLGKPADETASGGWTLPVCVAPQGGKEPECATLMSGAPAMVGGRSCPKYVHPNARGGYYRFSLVPAQYERLAAARKDLDVPERAALLSNAWAQVRAGRLGPDVVTRMLPAFDAETSRPLVEQVVTILDEMDLLLVEDAARPAFRRFVAARLGARKKALGWQPKAGEAAGAGDEAILRRTVLRAMGDLAEDETTLREADELTTQWLADPSKIDADAAAIAVDLASRHAGAARLDELRAFAKGAKSPEHRAVAIRAMAGFDDDEVLRRGLSVALGPEIRTHETNRVLGAAFGRRRARPTAEAWVRENWDALRQKLPGSLGVALFRGASVACTDEDTEKRAAFYAPRAAAVEGADRPLREALESARLCAALRKEMATKLTRALADAKP